MESSSLKVVSSTCAMMLYCMSNVRVHGRPTMTTRQINPLFDNVQVPICSPWWTGTGHETASIIAFFSSLSLSLLANILLFNFVESKSSQPRGLDCRVTHCDMHVRPRRSREEEEKHNDDDRQRKLGDFFHNIFFYLSTFTLFFCGKSLSRHLQKCYTRNDGIFKTVLCQTLDIGRLKNRFVQCSTLENSIFECPTVRQSSQPRGLDCRVTHCDMHVRPRRPREEEKKTQRRRPSKKVGRFFFIIFSFISRHLQKRYTRNDGILKTVLCQTLGIGRLKNRFVQCSTLENSIFECPTVRQSIVFEISSFWVLFV
jgi:hypothetical protein